MGSAPLPPVGGGAEHLRRRLSALRAAGPVDHALDAGLLALDVTNAYRHALMARDAVLAAGSHSGESDELVAELARRQAVVVELRGLVSEARQLAASHISGRADPQGGWPDLGLPDDCAERVRAIAGQQRLMEMYLPALAASRNAAAAALVAHAGWEVAAAARLARTTAECVIRAGAAVDPRLPSYPDPSTVAELAEIVDALAGRRYALGELQDEAMLELLAAGVPHRRVAALAQVPVEHVTQLRPVTRTRRHATRLRRVA